MANNLYQVGTYKFIRSTDIDVYPCSYRGYKKDEDPDTGVFATSMLDPESRMMTERNYANRIGLNFYGSIPNIDQQGNVDLEESEGINLESNNYIISYVPTVNNITHKITSATFELCLTGRYFKIELAEDDIPTVDQAMQEMSWNTVGIDLYKNELIGIYEAGVQEQGTYESKDYKTSILRNLYDPNNGSGNARSKYLDSLIPNIDDLNAENDRPYSLFTGLAFGTNLDNSIPYQLQLFKVKDNGAEAEVRYTAEVCYENQRLPIKLADLNAKSGHIITSADDDINIVGSKKAITGDKEFQGNIIIQNGDGKSVLVKHNVTTEIANITNKLGTDYKLEIKTGNDGANDYTFKINNKQIDINATTINQVANEVKAGDEDIVGNITTHLDNNKTITIKHNTNPSDPNNPETDFVKLTASSKTVNLNGTEIINLGPNGYLEVQNNNNTTAFKVNKDNVVINKKIKTDDQNKIVQVEEGTIFKKEMIEADGTTKTYKTITVPDYNTDQAYYLLGVSSDGATIEWKAPYENEYSNAQ